MDGLIIGSDALARGMLTRARLRWNYRRIYPDVYLRSDQPVTLRTRTIAAWLWSGRRAVIAGRAAAALRGTRWIDQDIPIELIWSCPRAPAGIIARNERIGADEIVDIGGMAVTTTTRTALDLGRHLDTLPALVHLDSLARATSFDPSAAHALSYRYSGARGVARSRLAVSLCDAGSQSPKETWLRLILINAGFPRPQTQVHISDGFNDAFIDMGWEEPKIGLDYEGEHHRAERGIYVHDIGRYELIERQGWVDLRVVAEHSPRFIVERVAAAFRRRGREPLSLRRNCA